MIRRVSRPVPVWADGTTWPSIAEYRQAQRLAVEVSGPDVQLIDQLVRHCETARRRGRPDMVHGSSWDTEERRQKLVRDLYERAGAATAAEDNPLAVPLTVEEIRLIERVRHDIQYFTGYYLPHGARDPMLDKADDLLNRLHFLAGRARAIEALGGVAIFPAASGRVRDVRAALGGTPGGAS
jgi:hypothetical protein